jgi:hypothetical protein
MDVILMAVIFLGPGLFIKAMDKYVYKPARPRMQFYDYAFELIAHSIVVFSLMALIGVILNAAHILKPAITTVGCLMARMDSICFVVVYIVVAAAISVGWWLVYDKFGKKRLTALRNRFAEKKTGTRHTGRTSVYEDIFHNPEIVHAAYMAVSIYQNGEYVTSGLIRGFNSPDLDVAEYRLIRTNEIEEIIASDKEKADDDKILIYTDFEYFNPAQNLLIKFYRHNRLERHWAQYKQD